MWLSFACTEAKHKPEDEVVYKGPLVEAEDVLTLYSDSAKLKVKLTAPVQQEFENGDGIFPKGINVAFFEVEGKPTTTLRANYGKFDKRKNLYLVTGNVVVKNTRKKETLNTEELYWDKPKQEVYTDKFVRIETPTEILTGEGLRANQDFSKYRILKPSGIFTIQQ
ncbi:MAG: LPS export ABC transporter periplasmic protein LptC [Sphingobacteriales bacterium]|nr:MAG: LPS export ABC transporter periplasmic protein LptC [Sphingobacteriales bacterium]